MAYYCSVECQHAHWKAGGHKRACRSVLKTRTSQWAQIEKYDIMVLRYFDSDEDVVEELNGHLVHAVKPDKDDPNRYIVKLDGKLVDARITVPRKNLYHIRPAA